MDFLAFATGLFSVEMVHPERDCIATVAERGKLVGQPCSATGWCGVGDGCFGFYGQLTVAFAFDAHWVVSLGRIGVSGFRIFQFFGFYVRGGGQSSG